jgi:hypothetical protein
MRQQNRHVDNSPEILKGTIFTDSPGMEKTKPRPFLKLQTRSVEKKGGHFSVASFKIGKRVSNRELN